LAEHMVRQGGALLSEYNVGVPAYPSNFVERNRLVSGISSAILITEAAEKSGTLHTARFALEQGREVLTVPGNILSPQSAGTNHLIKTGATPVTSVDDIFHVLGIRAGPQKQAVQGANAIEQTIIDLLAGGEDEGAVLLERSGLEVQLFNQALTMLEITGKIRALGANRWSL